MVSGMRERHWTEIENITGLYIPKDEVITMTILMEIGVQSYCKEIEDICVSASKEYGLQIAMNKMEAEWENMIFATKEYRTSGTSRHTQLHTKLNTQLHTNLILNAILSSSC